MPDRQSLRQLVRERRRALTQDEQQAAARQLLTQCQHHPRLLAARHIALYLANDGELDTGPLIDWLWSQDKRIYLPVLHPFNPGHLLFLHYTATSPMTLNRFGIPEPEFDELHLLPHSDLDIICTPLVAFDATGNRLGMGGGYYDRTLTRWQSHKEGPLPLGIAHDCQRVETIPCESWDVPLPEIITPSRRWCFEAR